MSILFTGLAENVCAELVRSLNTNAAVQFLPPEKALAASEIQGAQRVVWFYHAPWAMPQVVASGSTEPSVAKQFNDWLRWSRTLLRKRRTLGNRLVLVNIERMDYSQLMAFLGLQGDHSITRWKNGGISAGERAVGMLLAEPFSAIAPEHWDVFELLETLAWRPSSVADGVVETISISKDAGLQILQMLTDSQTVGGLKAALDAARGEIASKAKEAERLRDEVNRMRVEAASSNARRDRHKARLQMLVLKLRAHADGIEAENKALLEQLYQFHVAFDAELIVVQEVQAGRGKQLAEHEQQLGKARAELKLKSDVLAANESTLQKAREAQQQLESNLIEARQETTAVQQLLSTAKAELEGCKVELENLRKLRQQLLDSSESQAAALAVAKQDASEKQMCIAEIHNENEQLLQQMRMVQEELEHYFLENRVLQDAVAQGHHSLDRSREVISRLLLAQGRLHSVQSSVRLDAVV